MLRAQEFEVVAMETEVVTSGLEDSAAYRPSHEAGDDSDDDNDGVIDIDDSCPL